MATVKRDYYEILNVERTASAQEIKSAYRKLAVRYHPDKNPGDREAEERFKEAAEAYAVLGNPEQKARYDRFGHAGLGGVGGGGFDPTVFSDFSDILGDLFGFGDLFGGRGGRRAGRGADLRYDLPLTFEEAAFGTQETLEIPRLETCETCSGSGSKDGERSTCSTCGGRGQVRFTQGFFTVARTCPQCQGQGQVVSDPCADCRGEGRIERRRKLTVDIPAGVDTGARLRLVGEGEHGARGGPPGDLYVVLAVEPHERFERDGADVHAELAVSYPQAVLGAKLEIETIHGTDDVEVPPGTGHGERLRLRGKGIDRVNSSGRGDHILHVHLHVPNPKQLDEEARELLERLAQVQGTPVREGKRRLEKVKEFFG